MEDIKKSRGKIGTNAYRTNISTLKRIAEYDFANIPIEKVKREHKESILKVFLKIVLKMKEINLIL